MMLIYIQDDQKCGETYRVNVNACVGIHMEGLQAGAVSVNNHASGAAADLLL